MSDQTISEYMVSNCPEKRDIYAITSSVVHVLTHDRSCGNIIIDPECILYDRYRRKVKFKKRAGINRRPKEDAETLFRYLKDECMYAGKDTYLFICSFCEIYERTYKSDSELKECTDYLKKHNSMGNSMKYALVLFICVFIMETFICLIGIYR